MTWLKLIIYSLPKIEQAPAIYRTEQIQNYRTVKLETSRLPPPAPRLQLWRAPTP
jgi:hypothetical protein